MLKKNNIIKLLFWLVFGPIIFLNVCFVPNLHANEILFFLYQDPFGNVEMQQGQPAANPEFKYTDKEYEEDLDAFYFQARYYDPVAGRFWGRDPVQLENSPKAYFQINPFVYVMNNPVNRIDSDGKLGRISLSKYGAQGHIFYMDPGDSVKPLISNTGFNLKSFTGKDMLVLNGTFIDEPNKHYFGAVKYEGNIYFQTEGRNPSGKTIEVNNFLVEIKQRSGIAFDNDGTAMIGSWDEIINSKYENAMVGGLQIISNGEIVKKPLGLTAGTRFNSIGDRIAIGINNKGKMSVIVPNKRMTGPELATLVQKSGYRDAIVFDANSKAFVNYKGQQIIGGQYNGSNYTGFQFSESK